MSALVSNLTNNKGIIRFRFAFNWNGAAYESTNSIETAAIAASTEHAEDYRYERLKFCPI